MVERHAQDQHDGQPGGLGRANLIEHAGVFPRELEPSAVPVALASVDGRGHGVHPDVAQRADPAPVVRLVDLDSSEEKPVARSERLVGPRTQQRAEDQSCYQNARHHDPSSLPASR